MDEVVVAPNQGVPTGSRQLGSKYFLGEQLGRGAMGVVHAATNRDNEPLAVKILRPELSTDDRTVARFVQERQIFNRIDHPNVVRVHDLVAEGDQLGIVMEKVNGGDLKQRVEERSLTSMQAMQIATEIAAGLEAIHAVDVVHRDLKPANVLLAEAEDGSLHPKISDFGISRLVSEAMTRTSTTIGTPLYMAPEAADKRGAQSPADIYSLGALMFELLIGTAPFHEGGTFAVLKAHAVEQPPAIGGIPPQLAELIDQMLAKEPSVRPTATAVRQRLLSILPQIDDAISPIAIDRPMSDEAMAENWAAAAAADSTGGIAIDGGAAAVAGAAGLAGMVGGSEDSNDSAVTSIDGGLGAAASVDSPLDAVLDISNAETRIEPIVRPVDDPSDSSETVIMRADGTATPSSNGDAGAAASAAAAGLAGGATGASTGTGDAAMYAAGLDDSSETVMDSNGVAAAAAVAGAGAAFAAPPPPPPQADVAGPIADAPDNADSAANADPQTYQAGHDVYAPPVPPTTTGRTSISFFDRPGRLAGIGVAAVSVAAIGAVAFFALSGDDNPDDAALDGSSQIEAGEGDVDTDDGEGVGGESSGSNGDGSQSQFPSTIGDDEGSTSDTADSSSDNAPPTTVEDGSAGPTTTEAGGSSTTEQGTSTSADGSSTTDAPATTTPAPTTATTGQTTTTQGTTTTRPTTSTTVTTTTSPPAATPIRIVSGPSVNVVTASSFQFNYSTNDVCGTGSFRVFNRDSGTLIGSNTGNDVCFGPLHGGFPQASHPTFGGYNLEPNTAYRVVVTVRGTASDGVRTAGSGSDSATFFVTTTS